jgi:lipopolysaccharide assembly outer membrane protein LptD (OstA)
MRRAVSVAVILSIALLASSSATAQKNSSEMNAQLTALIRARIESQQPMRLSAETITLTGDTLRLAGRALIRFNDTSIRAEEIVINPVMKRVDLLGNVNAFLGSDVALPVPPIEFR